MKITALAFKEGEKIPSKYSCDGENVNPALEIHDVPAETKSLVLIMDDPDVPEYKRPDRLFVHWVITNIPPQTRHIKEASTPPGIEGKNTMGEVGYRGPCPPDKEHRYFFKLYALDIFLDLDAAATKDTVEKAMTGHIIAQAELMGRYDRPR